MVVSLLFLAFVSVFLSSFYLWLSAPLMVLSQCLTLKFYPFILSLVIFLIFYVSSFFGKGVNFYVGGLLYYFSTIMFLTPVCSSVVRRFYYSFGVKVVKFFETNLLSRVSNSFFLFFFRLFSKSFLLSFLNVYF